MDMREFLNNRSQVPASELEKHAGKYVAWSPDGKKIIAADQDPMKVVAAVKSAGYDSAECVLSSIPSSDEVVMGGGLDE
jgi:glucose/arabinose dehydrogenase